MVLQALPYQFQSKRIPTMSAFTAPNTASLLVTGWIQSNITRTRSLQYQLKPTVTSLYWPALTLLRSRCDQRAFASQAPQLRAPGTANTLLYGTLRAN